MKRIRIATRQSALALWQANFVKDQLQLRYPDYDISLVRKTTKGDILLDSPLSKIGGKGLFVKELETALLDNEADIAVHSLKDVPMDLPSGLELTCICERHSPFDAVVSNRYSSIDDLPQKAIVGTSSLRRQAQLLRYRPDLDVQSLRGNVNSRLQKLDDGQYDAIILAAAGLDRLGFSERITQLLNQQQSLPAVGQGAMAIETRSGENYAQLLSSLHHQPTTYCITAERALNKRLSGGCQVPIAAYATLDDEINPQTITMNALVSNSQGTETIEVSGSSSCDDAEQLGKQLAEQLLSNGAREILSSFGIEA